MRSEGDARSRRMFSRLKWIHKALQAPGCRVRTVYDASLSVRTSLYESLTSGSSPDVMTSRSSGAAGNCAWTMPARSTRIGDDRNMVTIVQSQGKQTKVASSSVNGKHGPYIAPTRHQVLGMFENLSTRRFYFYHPLLSNVNQQRNWTYVPGS